ncbi:hypothetical protein SLA2020_010560 [Shorea laevis]
MDNKRMHILLQVLVVVLTMEQLYWHWVGVVVPSFVMLCDVVRHYIENDSDNYCSRDEFLSSHSRMQYIGRLVDCDNLTCVEQLRMNRAAFNRLCDLLRTEGKLKNSGSVSVKEQVAMFLYILGHDKKNRVIKLDFIRSGETVSRHFNKVLNAVIKCSESLTSMPEPVLEGCTDGKWKWFKNCLGALDGTHIKVRVPLIDKSRYRNRKGDITTNVLGVCSRNLQFVFVLPGWEGSASDSRVLRDAIARENGLRVPIGYYYLVDAGYTNGSGFLAPYRGTRYHLSEWRQGFTPSNPQELFNLRHAKQGIQLRGHLGCSRCVGREMPYDPFEHLLDQVEPSVEMEPIENIASVESTDEWNTWRDNLAQEMYDEWMNNRHHI